MRLFRDVIVLGLLISMVVACDRKTRTYAAKEGQTGTPAYTARAALATVSSDSNIAEVAPVTAASKPDGGALYATNCATCHQATGQGIAAVFPPLDGSVYVTGDKVERLAAIMIYGLMGPVNVNGTTYNSMMAPMGGALDDNQLAAIATHIRSSWSNKASAVEAGVFSEVRKKYGTRGPFSISDLGEETS